MEFLFYATSGLPPEVADVGKKNIALQKTFWKNKKIYFYVIIVY